MRKIEVIQRSDIVLRFLVLRVVEHEPFKAVFKIPLTELCKLAAHEKQLFSGVSHHEGEIRPELRKFVFVGTEHLIDERFFAVHHLVVAYWENIAFAEGVDDRKCHLMVTAGAEIGIRFDVRKSIVHPAHIPFEVEAETGFVGYFGVGGRFLGNHERVGEVLLHGGIQRLEEGD